jgi:glyceraldehyde 3-phosphate dehydrogenase
MAVKVGINGFGRIGRNIMRASLGSKDIDFVAVNDLTSAATLAHLLKYDSVLGNLHARVEAKGDAISVDGDEFKVLSMRDPAQLPWKDLGVDIVFESTGLFTKRDDAAKHLAAGAKKVVITAPAKGPDVTLVLGVNDEKYDPAKHHVISNASCTTNCLAPVVKVLNDKIGVVNGIMTTIHSYTNDQVLTDVYHTDLRRARSATMSMIPTKTGAAAAVGLVLPELKDKLDGFAVRVPTINVSLVDLTFVAKRATSIDEINKLMKEAAAGAFKGILAYSDGPLVSVDFNHDPASSTYDATLTKVIDTTVKVCAWYDNEWGFSNRMLDTTVAFANAK